MHAVLVSADLMLVSATQGAADRQEVTLRVTGQAGEAAAWCADGQTGLVIVDLRLPGLDIAALVAQVREGAMCPVRIVACGPHVYEHLLAAAGEAGCDAVLTRGEFERKIGAYFEPLTDASSAPRRPR